MKLVFEINPNNTLDITDTIAMLRALPAFVEWTPPLADEQSPASIADGRFGKLIETYTPPTNTAGGTVPNVLTPIGAALTLSEAVAPPKPATEAETIAALQAFTNREGFAAARALLDAMDAPRVTDLPAERRAEFIQRTTGTTPEVTK